MKSSYYKHNKNQNIDDYEDEYDERLGGGGFEKIRRRDKMHRREDKPRDKKENFKNQEVIS